MFPVHRGHLDALSTSIGIHQHARADRPDPAHGYCTDDVSRALLVDLLHQREIGWDTVAPSAIRNIAFLGQAFEEATGRFRNFRTADGEWSEAPGSEDSCARALYGLGEAIASCPPGAPRDEARDLFERALHASSRVTHLRPMATVLLACDAAERGGLRGEVAEVYQRVGHDLRSVFESRLVTHAWPWPEERLTYENELPARALITGGYRLGHRRMARIGLRVLDWLIDAQTWQGGVLSTIGNAGWWSKGTEMAHFDQQPISATSLLLAADAAHRATGRERYAKAMEMSYGWFLGRNILGCCVAEPMFGACHDGFGPAGVNENQGAESTLMWLMAVEHIRALRAAPPTANEVAPRVPAAVR